MMRAHLGQSAGSSTWLLALVAATACGIDEDQFTIAVCESEQWRDRYFVVEHVRPAIDVDYLDLREVYPDPEDPSVSIVDAIGAPCAGASDQTSCIAAFEGLPVDSDFVIVTNSDCCLEYRLLGFTRGDETSVIGTTPALEGFLGAIDAPGDAALVVMITNPRYRLRCDAPAQVGAHEDGFVVYTRTGRTCGHEPGIVDNAILVRGDGSIEILDSELVERGDPDCSP